VYSNNEVACTCKKIIKIETPEFAIRSDNAKTPRIELLMRTNYTAFDGMVNPADSCARIKKYGMPSVAFADKLNCQSFLAIEDMAKKNSLKAGYGVEFDIQNDAIELVKNPIDILLTSASYVVFDLETSGFYNEYDDIIEFGAVRVCNGTIKERIDFFIKPTKPISYKISELTHITNELLEQNGLEIKEGLMKIKE
jgi:DNA polymerase-3 subunit alpha (Gram-positive type)